MVSPISHPAQSQQAASQPAVTRQPAPQARPQPTANPTDMVRLSSVQTPPQEASETPAQTARETSIGNIQAKNLLAREAADRANG